MRLGRTWSKEAFAKGMRKENTQKILCRRLGGTGDTSELPRHIQKPKGMHWQTFWRLRMAALEAYERSLRSWFVHASRFLGRLPEDERESRIPD